MTRHAPPPIVEGDTSWMRDAACADQGHDLWFGTKAEQQQAKRVCVDCDVMEDCLAYAVRTGQTDGVWGGMDEDERARAVPSVRRQHLRQCPICEQDFYSSDNRAARVCCSEFCRRVRRRLEGVSA